MPRKKVEKVVEVEETITSEDGTLTVPVSEIKEGLKNFEELSPEEQEQVRPPEEVTPVVEVVKTEVPKFKCSNCEDSGRACYMCNPQG